MASGGPNPSEDEQLAGLRLPPDESKPPPRPDAETSQESADLDLQKQRAELEVLQASVQKALAEIQGTQIHNAGQAQDIRAREQFASLLFRLTCFWLVLVVAIVLAAGRHGLALSDAVIIALIGTTTVNVLAFFRCVTAYLFPSDKSGAGAKEKEDVTKADKK